MFFPDSSSDDDSVGDQIRDREVKDRGSAGRGERSSGADTSSTGGSARDTPPHPKTTSAHMSQQPLPPPPQSMQQQLQQQQQQQHRHHHHHHHTKCVPTCIYKPIYPSSARKSYNIIYKTFCRLAGFLTVRPVAECPGTTVPVIGKSPGRLSNLLPARNRRKSNAISPK